MGLGCNNFGRKLDTAATADVVHAALEAGITHFDTAEMYGGGASEKFLGDALRTRRDEVVIATKFSPRPEDEPYRPGVLRQRILDACHQSLSRLSTDRIDLYYQHFPDVDGSIEEGLETLDGLVREGKVLHIASSNVDAGQIDAAVDAAAAKDLVAFTATQIHWNLLERGVEASVVPTARRHAMGIVPFYPLASGLLTGKYKRNEPAPEGSRLAGHPVADGQFETIEKLTAFAEARGHSVLDLAVAWLAAQDGVASVISGATTTDQVRVNAAAAGWRLQLTDLDALSAL